ncbi:MULTISPECIES: hypothetical protein [Tatumella]|uniref:YjbD family (DUF3811) n=1 Tax=Tatumella punctata TaxID=399969 RepID=A0ABW1VJK0_9GAMM|nr:MULTISPECIES: hypothetical protein [unclassified Tatumella]MBS0855159.1 hypothetical protein [Tatumella sp. JGM16]MBS0912054.1 hypothetical protein [Tatumella sp. JGM91]
MADKKMISIDQFDTEDRQAIQILYHQLIEKYRQRTGRLPDVKKEKEFTAEARQQIMSQKVSKEKAAAEKAQKKPGRKKKPQSLAASEVKDFNWSASVAKGRRC